MTAFCLPPPSPSFTRQHHRSSTRPPPPTRRRRPSATFRAPSIYPPQKPPDYYANVGKVIDTLRHDVPEMLSTPPEMSIYTDTVTFTDGSGYRIRGKEAYKTILWLLRVQSKLVFATAFVSVQSIYHDSCNACVYLRWRLTAHPRWGVAVCVVDGMSVYRLDARGWVYEHALENGVRRSDKRPVFSLGVDRPVGVGAGVGVGPGWYTSDRDWLSVVEEMEHVRLHR